MNRHTKNKRGFMMIIGIILLFIFTTFIFYSTYISSLYALEILQCEPRNFPWNGIIITSISFISLMIMIPLKEYVALFFLLLSALVWFLHFASYLIRIVKRENIYPFTPEFHIYFLVSVIIHVLLVVAILRI